MSIYGSVGNAKRDCNWGLILFVKLTVFRWHQKVAFKKGNYNVNVSCETLVLSKDFPTFMLSKSLLYARKISIFPTFTALCCESHFFMLGKSLFSTRVSSVTFAVYGLKKAQPTSDNPSLRLFFITFLLIPPTPSKKGDIISWTVP